MTMKTEATVVHPNLAAALAAFQQTIPAIAKGKTGDGGTYKYQYAGLDDITPLALPLLAAQGLAWVTKPTLMGDAFVLQYKLSHAGSDEAEEGVYPLPDPTTAKPQAIGSAITYARRYVLCAVTGIAPGGDDDDAAAANEKPAAGRKPRAVAAKPAPEQQVASQNWAEDIAAAGSIDQLRALHELVESAGELGAVFAEEHGAAIIWLMERYQLDNVRKSTKVGELIGMVRDVMKALPQEEPGEAVAAEDVPAALADWNVVEIPNGGEE